MADTNALVKQAAVAYKEGRREDARTLLMQVVDQDERNEQAWLMLSALVDTLEEQQICLENVLAVNSNNDRAQKGLATVNQKLNMRGGSAPAPSAPPAPTQRSGREPIGAEFDSSLQGSSAEPFGGGFEPDSQAKPGGDFSPWGTNNSAPADQNPFGQWDTSLSQDQSPPGSAFDSWGAAGNQPPASPPARDPGAPATSVDWGREDGPAAHGSGKQVELPSEQEYENWVQGLNLDRSLGDSGLSGSNADASSSFFSPGAASPFGDTPFSTGSDASEPGRPSDPFGSGDVFGAAGSEPDPWSSGSTLGADVSSTQPGGGAVSPFDAPSPQGSSPFEATPFGASSPFSGDDLRNATLANDDADPFGGALAEDGDMPDSSPFGATFDPGPSGGAVAEIVDFDGEMGDLEGEWESTAKGSPKAGKAQGSARTSPAQDYFRYIPADIEAKAAKTSSPAALVGVLLLVILNLASFGFLVVQLAM